MSEMISQLSAALADRYTIDGPLGEGGMATVYRAQDRKHARPVALKILKPELAAVMGAERFLQEIQTTANLQHPNILPLFDSGMAVAQDSGMTFFYYVMPYIEGETLREKLSRERQFDIDEAVQIATDVADALEYAHRHGVVHRDIKPENILLHDGRPMVVDFGIALAVSSAGGTRLTETGISIGTPHYMSPEQAVGERDVDGRADIYSLGAVVYEMLTGDPPYDASSAQAIIAKILADTPPPIARARTLVPPNVEAAVHKAMAKSRADRFGSAMQFAEALRDPTFTLANVPSAGPPVAAAGPGRKVAVALALWAIVATGAAAWALLQSPPTTPVVRHRFDAAAGEERLGAAALSPDGRMLVYEGPGARGGQLWRRARDSLHARPMPGTQSAYSPFFSSDGRHVGFFTVDPEALSLVPVDGGAVTRIVEAGAFNRAGGASSGSDGYMYFAGPVRVPVPSRGIYRVPETGGEPEVVTVPDPSSGEIGHRWPSALPSGRGVLFTVIRGMDPELFDIGVTGSAGGSHDVLTRGVYARYAPSGHLLVVSADGTLRAFPFDARSRSITGPDQVVAEDVRVRAGGATTTAGNFGAVVQISSSGTLAYLRDATDAVGAVGSDRSLVWVSRDGGEQAVFPDWQATFRSVRISPGGTHLVTAIVERSRTDVWVRAFAGGPPLKLTFAKRANYRPVWSHDGRSVTWAGYDSLATINLYRRSATGTGSEQVLLQRPRPVVEGLWSPNGEWLVFRTDNNQPDRGDILAYHVARDTTVPLIATRFEEHSPELSPDGRWLAYVSDQGGKPDVYVRPFPDTDAGVWRVSDGGTQPMWSHSGREVFYQDERGRMVAATVEAGATFAVGERTTLFSTARYLRSRGTSIGAFNHTVYAVDADDRFLMIRMPENTEGELILIDNFFQDLRERARR